MKALKSAVNGEYFLRDGIRENSYVKASFCHHRIINSSLPTDTETQRTFTTNTNSSPLQTATDTNMVHQPVATPGGAINDAEEDYDVFPNDDSPRFFVDPESMAMLAADDRGRSSGSGRRFGGGGSRASRSAATTQLATDVGSTIGAVKNPCLKSITFFDPKVYYKARKNKEGVEGEEDVEVSDDGIGGGDGNEDEEDDDVTFEINDLTHWDIKLKDPTVEDNGNRKGGLVRKLSGNLKEKMGKSKKPQLVVVDFDGLVEFSSLEPGDKLVAINKRKIEADEFTAEQAYSYMKDCLETEGVLNVTTENPNGDDIVVNVTVIKPRPDMTYEDLGLLVWNWPYLCVREVKPESIFEHTAIRETDQIAAINDIDCSKMREKAFAQCVNELPTEITITLIRRKHRYTGSFS